MSNLENLIERHKIYRNFVKTQNEVISLYWSKNIKDFDSELKHNGWKNLGKQDFFPLKSIESEGLKSITNNPINNSFINNQEFYGKIKKNYLNEKTETVLEIGAGVGILSSLIAQNEKIKYFIIDIPQMIVNSSSYLMTIFPKKKFSLPNELETNKSFEEKDIIFLMPSQIELIKDNFFDLIVANQNFQEMNYEQIKKYFELIKRTLKYDGIFFTSNRLRKETKFFNYSWNKLDNFKILSISKNKFHITYGNPLTYIDKIMIKKKSDKKVYNLNIFRKIILMNSYNFSEYLFWLNQDYKRIIRKFVNFFFKR
jgi:ubiquinone/menaquinone biosynthesis C-methylase UbiE